MSENYIFLADDDEDDRMLFSEALEEQCPNASILTFDNGVDLMANLLNKDQHLPDVIFLDLNMPMMNGEECLNDIRMEPKLANIPVIIYSTSLDPQQVETLRINGANRYLKKPENFNKLKLTLDRAIKSVLNKENEIASDLEFVVKY
ncbi:Regulator of RpoS [Arenibacter antarcticus]|uniref:Response regulator n=1 Tax=Arenibacter antarcticus TaxID=2040469 RepID=A0ABW5VKF7_9FLAO|nr:response regulator [Arenibacter sp. H213]